MNCDEPSYDQYEQTMHTIRCSPDSPQPANVLEGMNILLREALGTGKKTVAHATCNMLKSPMLDIWANVILYLANSFKRPVTAPVSKNTFTVEEVPIIASIVELPKSRDLSDNAESNYGAPRDTLGMFQSFTAAAAHVMTS
ncbi:hypothetical protein C8R48DRAFT_779147 [Suillus tomentosus]|nr:hypothetical protein C8R48DRAFT_779147 [Suillus tomentosus]